MKRVVGTVGALALASAILSGCGAANNAGNNTTNSTASNTTTTSNGSALTTTNSSGGGKTVIVGASGYQGQANLKKYEDAAKGEPKDVQAQLNAGVAAHVNGNDTAAIAYYKKAIAIDPKSAVAYNNIGNIYLRDKKDVKTAIGYYEQATKADPTYGYGWWNLAIADSQAGHNQAAQQAVASGLKCVKQSDPVYKSLQQMQKQLKSSK